MALASRRGALFALLSVVASCAATPAGGSTRILFVGNSFTYGPAAYDAPNGALNNLPRLVKFIAEGLGLGPIDVAEDTTGACSLFAAHRPSANSESCDSGVDEADLEVPRNAAYGAHRILTHETRFACCSSSSSSSSSSSYFRVAKPASSPLPRHERATTHMSTTEWHILIYPPSPAGRRRRRLGACRGQQVGVEEAAEQVLPTTPAQNAPTPPSAAPKRCRTVANARVDADERCTINASIRVTSDDWHPCPQLLARQPYGSWDFVVLQVPFSQRLDQRVASRLNGKPV